MISKTEIFNDIINIRKKTTLLSNPLYNDFVGSHFWKDIDNKLEEVENLLINDKNI